MRILQVIEALTIGGAERFVVELDSELARRGEDCSVLCLSSPGEWAHLVEAAGRYAGCTAKKRGIDLVALRRLRRKIGEIAPDIVHSHLFTANLWTRLAGLPERDFGIVVTLHNIDSWRNIVHRTVDRALAGFADRYVAVSQAVRDYHVRGGLRPNALRTIQNGVHIEEVAVPEPMTRETPVIRACGRLVPQKGFRTLVAAAAVLAARERRFRLEIIGDGPERGALASDILAAGLGDHVVLAGAKPDARQLIADCDIFVLSSDREGLPLVLLEALHAGRPVVASNIPSLSGVVVHGESALLVEPHSPEALARALERLLLSPDEARALGRAGKARAAAEFSMEKTAAAYVEVYREVLRERRQ